MTSHPSVYGWMPTSELGGADGEPGGISGGVGGRRGGGGTPGGGEGGYATWMVVSRSEGARPRSAATAAPMEAADAAKQAPALGEELTPDERDAAAGACDLVGDAVAHMRREAAFFGAMFEAADFEALT